ncbi:MAG: hypothetical protein M3R22_05290, partial [Pseudomonadota bacterium]|nr:hypothetical protein [Pseudomonadota bacterium]
MIEVSALRLVKAAAALAAAMSLFGCANPPHRAPVEERSATPRATVAAASPALAPASAVDAGKPVTVDSGPRAGFYTVKPGDTLIRIGLD